MIWAGGIHYLRIGNLVQADKSFHLTKKTCREDVIKWHPVYTLLTCIFYIDDWWLFSLLWDINLMYYFRYGKQLFFYSQFNHVENIKCQQVLSLFYLLTVTCFWASQVGQVVQNPPANEGDTRDMGLILGLGRSPGGGHDNPLQYSCLENPMDREP